MQWEVLFYCSVLYRCLLHCTITVCVAGVWYIALLQCVVQVFGGPGSGKTQLCLTTSALCALGGGKVAFIDTRGDLDTARLLQVGKDTFWLIRLGSPVGNRPSQCKVHSSAKLTFVQSPPPSKIHPYAKHTSMQIRLALQSLPICHMITSSRLPRDSYFFCLYYYMLYL